MHEVLRLLADQIWMSRSLRIDYGIMPQSMPMAALALLARVPQNNP